MKQRIVTLLSLIITMTAVAQHHERHDTLTLEQWKREVTRVPVLTGQTQPQLIVPHQQPLCFNVEFDLKMSIRTKMVEQCMFVNTSMGITGYLPPSGNGLINVIMPEIPDFNFSVISMKGNVYHYFTRKGKNDALESYVLTSNSQTYQYQLPAGSTSTSTNPDSSTLFRKNETGQYCNGNMTAMAYRNASSTTTWFIYGSRFPEKLHPRKYLGNFGVGYFYMDEGLYIVTEIRTPSYQCRVTDIQNSNACLNTQPFQSQEDKFNTNMAADIQKEKDKLDRDAAKVTGDCASEKMTLINFRKEIQQRQEELLRRSKEGNTMQPGDAQNAMLAMRDPAIAVQDGMLSLKVNICLATKHMNDPKTSASDRLVDSDKINCYGQQMSVLQDMLSRMHSLETQYASQPARAFMEKNRLYGSTHVPTCN